MKKINAFLVCFAILLSFTACHNGFKFREMENKIIVANDGTEYTLVGGEGTFRCFGEQAFIGHVKGEKKAFVHLSNVIKTGMYSVGGSRDVLIRYLPDNEFSVVYVKSDLLKTKIDLEHCIRLVFVEELFSNNVGIANSNNGIYECEAFLNEIKNGLEAKEAGLYDLVKQPDGAYENLYVYGYVCGVLQEDLNLVIPLEVWSFDDKAYSIRIEGKEYVLPQERLDQLIEK